MIVSVFFSNSFMVDARGGAMTGNRASGLRYRLKQFIISYYLKNSLRLKVYYLHNFQLFQ